MTEHEEIHRLIKGSLKSDCDHERRFALILSRVLAMREALSLEAAIQDDPMQKAMIDTGVVTLDSGIRVLRLFWNENE